MPKQQTSSTIRLSKSEYVQGIQCEKALWLAKNRKDIQPPIDPSVQAQFDLGNEIGELARQRFKGGKMISDAYYDIEKSAKLTQELVRNGQEVIFEAAAYDSESGIFCLVDILQKITDENSDTNESMDKWHLIEVKSSSTVKKYHHDDIAFQYYVFTRCGYNITKCSIMHVNNSYIRGVNIDPHGLLALDDVTKKVHEKEIHLAEKIEQLTTCIAQKNEPEVPINKKCFEPFECKYKFLCWENVPEYSIFDIYKKEKAFEIYDDIHSYDIKDIPPQYLPTAGRKSVDVSSLQQGKPHIEKAKIKDWLNELKYPLYFLDYETISSAIPFFEGTSPFKQIPFQFSLHIQKSSDAELEHFEFLHKEKSDPREEFAKALVSLCGNNGSVVVYHQSFEKGCNEELAKAFLQYADKLLAINNRMIDLLKPFKSRWLYDPAQQSSASIKAVHPAFVEGVSYKDLEGIANGQAAMGDYAAFIKGEMPLDNIETLWKNLLEYCKLDTLAMVQLINVLKQHTL